MRRRPVAGGVDVAPADEHEGVEDRDHAGGRRVAAAGPSLGGRSSGPAARGRHAVHVRGRRAPPPAGATAPRTASCR